MGVAGTGKMATRLVRLGKSEFFHPHISHPGFVVVFPQTSQQCRFEKEQRKAGETLRGETLRGEP